MAIERLVLGGAVVVLLCYAWLTAQSLEPKLDLPPAVVSELSWLIGGEQHDGTEVQRYKAEASARIATSLADLARVLPVIGGFRRPPEILIDADHADRYTIGDERIRISEKIAVADGQLVKALMKVWLLQRAGPEFTASLLRVEVVSDMLTAMLTRATTLGLSDGRVVTMPETLSSWLGFAKSFGTVCRSGWQSLELQGVCGESHALNAMVFRPFLDGLIWNSYLSTPPFRRYEFLRSWSRSLRASNEDLSAVRREEPKTLVEWRDWLGRELEKLVPMPDVRGDLAAAAARAGLRDAPAVSMILSPSGLGSDDLADDWVTALAGRAHGVFMVSVTHGERGRENWLLTTAPASAVQISERDLAEATTPLFVMQSCRAATLGELMSKGGKSERLLYIESCAPRPAVGWQTILSEGLRGFARAEPQTSFVQFQRSALALAFARGQLHSRDPVSKFMTTAPGAGRALLGLESAQWRREFGAYHVLGAIEAIEWFRGATIN